MFLQLKVTSILYHYLGLKAWKNAKLEYFLFIKNKTNLKHDNMEKAIKTKFYEKIFFDIYFLKWRSEKCSQFSNINRNSLKNQLDH